MVGLARGLPLTVRQRESALQYARRMTPTAPTRNRAFLRAVARAELAPLPLERCPDDAIPSRDTADPEDPFLYHVTDADAAARIETHGFEDGHRLVAQANGPYAGHARGRTFFTAADGVGFWQSSVEAHLLDTRDYDEDEAPQVVVLRVPRLALAADAVPDPLGTDDARAEALAVPTVALAGRPIVRPMPDGHERAVAAGQREMPLDPDMLANVRKLSAAERQGPLDLGFERMVQTHRNRVAVARALLGDGSTILEFPAARDHQDPTQLRSIHVFSRDPRADRSAGGWRLTTFDRDAGPSGHIALATLDEAAKELARYRGETVPGVVDTWALSGRWEETARRRAEWDAANTLPVAPAPTPARRRAAFGARTA